MPQVSVEFCRQIRRELLSISYQAKSNHLGPNLSLVELMAVLWNQFLQITPQNFAQKERDYFILSKGHAALVYYLMLAKRGFFPQEHLEKFWHQNDGPFCEHPLSTVPGVDVSTGSLGHGPGISAGLAYGLRASASHHKVVCLLGDGELNEGSVWEAAWWSTREKLGRLLWVIDSNGHQGLGPTAQVSFTNYREKFSSFGWQVHEVDGHSLVKIQNKLNKIDFSGSRPQVMIAQTVKGKGVPFMENQNHWHYQSLTAADFDSAKSFL